MLNSLSWLTGQYGQDHIDHTEMSVVDHFDTRQARLGHFFYAYNLTALNQYNFFLFYRLLMK